MGLDAFRDYTRQFADEWSADYDYEVEGFRRWMILRRKSLVRPWPQVVESVLSDMSTAPVAKEADYYRARIPSIRGTVLIGSRPGARQLCGIGARQLAASYPSQGRRAMRKRGCWTMRAAAVCGSDFRVIEEDQPRLLFMGGAGFLGIPKDNFDEAIGSSGGELTEIPAKHPAEIYIDPSTFWVGFNLRDPVLGPNKPLRMARGRLIVRRW